MGGGVLGGTIGPGTRSRRVTNWRSFVAGCREIQEQQRESTVPAKTSDTSRTDHDDDNDDATSTRSSVVERRIALRNRLLK